LVIDIAAYHTPIFAWFCGAHVMYVPSRWSQDIEVLIELNIPPVLISNSDWGPCSDVEVFIVLDVFLLASSGSVTSF